MAQTCKMQGRVHCDLVADAGQSRCGGWRPPSFVPERIRFHRSDIQSQAGSGSLCWGDGTLGRGGEQTPAQAPPPEFILSSVRSSKSLAS